jgi:hypothetical protein
MGGRQAPLLHGMSISAKKHIDQARIRLAS